MKKPLRYAGIVAGIGGALVLAGAMAHRQQRQEQQRQDAARDPMHLPSDSRRLMQLADTLSVRERKALFQQYAIGALFQISNKYPTSQNGFVGLTPQRLEVVFKRVAPVAGHPGRYFAAGLTKTRGRIRVLTGTIELRQVRYAWSAADNVYIATGVFHFKQLSKPGRPAAAWDGLVAIDFEVEHGQARLFREQGAMLPVSRGFAFEGTRAAGLDYRAERVLWADTFGPLGSSILADFGPGGRSLEVAPRYRKYGWDKYWENDEWWADSAKPRLALGTN